MSVTPENPVQAIQRQSYSADRGAAHARPSAYHGIWLIVRREIGTYFRSGVGYMCWALILFIGGLLYNGYAVGSSARYSTDVLSDFFYLASGMAMIGAWVFSMRLIAEDRQTGALPLLTTSSLSDGEIVIAKFLSGFLFLSLMVSGTVYMPLLILLNGKVSFAHILCGYVGLFAISAAAVAIGTFGSAIASSQVVAAIISGVIIVVFLQFNLIARVVEGKFGDLLYYLDLHVKHFRPFMEGTFSLTHLIYYVSVAVLFLVLARNSLEARRWRP
jgi:ABC-2 type transport system permease protein